MKKEDSMDNHTQDQCGPGLLRRASNSNQTVEKNEPAWVVELHVIVVRMKAPGTQSFDYSANHFMFNPISSLLTCISMHTDILMGLNPFIGRST
jgi:hypothetical protein